MGGRGPHQTAARHSASWCATSSGFRTVTWSVRLPDMASSSSEDDRLPEPADLRSARPDIATASYLDAI